MRKTRIRIKTSRRKYNYILIVVFYVLLPIMAIYIGLKITENLVKPALHRDDLLQEILNPVGEENRGEQESTEEGINDSRENVKMLEIRPMDVYAIQVASTSNTTYMEEFIEKLNTQKLSHLIYKLDNSYKVYILGATNRMDVEQELGKIREYYPDAFIAEIHLPSKKIHVEDKEDNVEAIINNFNKLIDLMDKLSDEWYNFLRGEETLNNYQKLLVEQKQILQELSSHFSNEELPQTLPTRENFEKMIHYQESNIHRALEVIENKGEVHRIHSLYLDSLFRIIELGKR